MLIKPFCVVYHVFLIVTPGEAQAGSALAREALAHLAASGKDENRNKERLAFLQCGEGSGLSIMSRVALAAMQLPARRQKIPGFLVKLLQPGAGALHPKFLQEALYNFNPCLRCTQALLCQSVDPFLYQSPRP